MRRAMWSSILAATLVAGDAAAQDAATQANTPARAESGRITVTAGVDFATAYLFRGIYQEDHGAIVPPYVDVGVLLYEGSGALERVTASVGNWNSLHSGPSGHGGRGNAWYEADYYGGVNFAVGNWRPGALFTSYTSPNDVFGTVHELSAVLAYDDSGRRVALAPKATIAFELHGQADGGARQGTYLELGIRPTVPLTTTDRYPVSLAMPVRVGLSLRGYYEGPDRNSRFGFFDTGLVASVPMPGTTVSWEIHGGFDLLWLGDAMAAGNGGGRFKPIGILGVSVTR